MSLYRKFHWKVAGNRRDAAEGERWKGVGLFVVVEFDVRNNIRPMCGMCTHTQNNRYAKYELFVLGGNLSGAVTVKGIPVAGDSWFAF